MPKVVHAGKPPEIPSDCRVACIGDFTIEFTIRKDGSVVDAVIVQRSPGNTSLDEQALQSVASMRFARPPADCRAMMGVKFREVSRT